MVPGRYRFPCKSCERVWVIGYAFYRAPMGPRPVPLDTLYPEWDKAPPFIGGVELGTAPRDRLNIVVEGKVGPGEPGPGEPGPGGKG